MQITNGLFRTLRFSSCEYFNTDIHYSIIINIPLVFNISTAGAAQGLKLTLNVERDEYMAGPISGSGVMVDIDSTLLMCNGKYYGILV